MANSDVDVSNNALLALGQGPPFIATMADTTKAAKICAQKLPSARQAVIRAHPWNFAVKRATITGKTITACVANAGLIQVTAVAHGFVTSDYVTIESVLGTVEANGQWTITKIDADNFTLQGSTFTSTYSSGGLVGLAPAFDFGYMQALPSDCLRVLMVSQGDDLWKVEGRYVLTDSSSIQLKYLKDETDYAKWDAMAYEALALYLAWEVCFALTQNQALRDSAFKAWDSYMPRARFVDATEDPAEELRNEELLISRTGRNQGFVRNPLT